MRRRRTAVLVAALLVAGPLAAEPSVTTAEAGGSRIVSAATGGTLVAALSLDDTLWLLVRPPAEVDGERRLLRLAQGAAPALDDRGALPGWSKSLHAIDLGSGPELLVGGLGRVATLGPLDAAAGGPSWLLLEDSDLDLRSVEPGRLRVGVARSLFAVSVGRLRRFVGAEGGLVERGAWSLPVAVVAERGGLRLSSPPAAPVGRPGGEPLVAVGPEAQGRTRLRSLVVSPEAGEEGVLEAWSNLRSPEAVEQHRFVLLDGRPYLVARTQGSDRLNLLERIRLRVLPLAADRTRSGFGASFAAELDSKRWHDLEIRVLDLDADGRDDLVVLRPEGFRGRDLVVESWPGRGGGRFEPRSRRVDLPGPIEAATLAPDLDGDGRADVLVVTEEGLALHAGTGGRSNPVRRKPAWRFALGSTEARRAVAVEVSDEGGDVASSAESGVEILGELEDAALLVLETSEGGESTLHRIEPPAGAP